MIALALIPKGALVAIIAVLGVALAGVGVVSVRQTLALASERTAHAKTQTEFAEARDKASQAQAEQQRQFRKQEQDWTTKFAGVSRDARKQIDRAKGDVVAAAAAGDKLRRREAELGACPSGPAQAATPATGSASAPSTTDLLADVRRRLDEAADRTAEFADASHIAGLACERSADAVTSPH